MDLNFQPPETEADLSSYSYFVAGSVGLMLLPILSSQAGKIQEPAKKLGSYAANEYSPGYRGRSCDESNLFTKRNDAAV